RLAHGPASHVARRRRAHLVEVLDPGEGVEHRARRLRTRRSDVLTRAQRHRALRELLASGLAQRGALGTFGSLTLAHGDVGIARGEVGTEPRRDLLADAGADVGRALAQSVTVAAARPRPRRARRVGRDAAAE